MAIIKLILDKRTPKKNDTYPIKLYIYDSGKPYFIGLGAYLTKKDFKDVFEKTPTGKRLEFRKSFELLLNKAQDLYRNMLPFDVSKFKEQLFQKQVDPIIDETSISDVYDRYISSKAKQLKYRTILGYKTSKNCILKFKPNTRIEDITIDFLESFVMWYNSEHPKTKLNSSSSIHLRKLRTVINWLKEDNKLPKGYQYPFGRNKYTINEISKEKETLSQDEIAKLISLDNFMSPEERRARNLWLIQYYCNGVNLFDLIRMRWDNQIGSCFVIQREKTKNTIKLKSQSIRIPIVPRLQILLEQEGKNDSPYVLGFLKDGLSERQILEKTRKLGRLMNSHLKNIGKRLNFSVELLSETARDAYATTLKRNGRSIEEIAEMLGHTSIKCTKNYLARFEFDHYHEINNSLP